MRVGSRRVARVSWGPKTAPGGRRRWSRLARPEAPRPRAPSRCGSPPRRGSPGADPTGTTGLPRSRAWLAVYWSRITPVLRRLTWATLRNRTARGAATGSEVDVDVEAVHLDETQPGVHACGLVRVGV